ncbi:hypothetical protein PUNSTDRAFT_133726 [Punctularia strigosozonata HHB-11173 SS5]|uniref:uncharacterized protein n=1 Tax=Punctularia strigosozonata (strain HHB-11173) TaxID=741275 RepID=UPI0004417F83|nr:uncharacterized protein PUNSTDRAFT_133726 [Punctularia strigosozonata HHB-11173 SS5]EIN09955.1 hypothetical protein PUNSTDRAFT_133726 [Punctularia strigosozonata HHB-11173 SS5]
MPDDYWERLPSTTNAEEAQHKKIYKALGKSGHTLLEGLKSLCGFFEHYKMLYNCSLQGAPIRYGKAEE